MNEPDLEKLRAAVETMDPDEKLLVLGLLIVLRDAGIIPLKD